LRNFKILVGNLKSIKKGIICDYPSPLGNPFLARKKDDKAERRIIVVAYGFYLHLVSKGNMEPAEAVERVACRWKQGISQLPPLLCSQPLPTRREFMGELNRIEGLARSKDIKLLCSYHPSQCHCDQVADYLRWRINVPPSLNIREVSAVLNNNRPKVES
jgi:hypothetical protein